MYETTNGYDSTDDSYHDNYGIDDEEQDNQLRTQLNPPRKRKKSKVKAATYNKPTKKGETKRRKLIVGPPSGGTKRPKTSE